MAIDLKLDDGKLSAVVSAAIMSAITAENRDEIIGKAVRDLMEKKRGQYGTGQSELEAAFSRAVVSVATDVCREWMNREENRKRIAAIIEEQLNKVLTAPETEPFADLFGKWLAGRLKDSY